jgi:hypothetical protein
MNNNPFTFRGIPHRMPCSCVRREELDVVGVEDRVKTYLTEEGVRGVSVLFQLSLRLRLGASDLFA